MKKTNFLVLLLASLYLFSCSEDDNETTSLTDTENATTIDCSVAQKKAFGIRNDVKLETIETIAANLAPYNTADFPDFSPVVQLQFQLGNSSYAASGTLISPEWVLTAAHIFAKKKEGKFTLISPETVTATFGNDPNSSSAKSKIAEIKIHPAYLAKHDDYDDYDMCLIKLSAPINNINPAKLYFNTKKLEKMTAWIAGFGQYKASQGQNPDLFAKKHAFQNVIDKVLTDSITTGTNTYKTVGLVVDFDDPCGKNNTLNDNKIFSEALAPITSNATPTKYEGVIVEGDSGGPMLAKINDQWQVVGISAYEVVFIEGKQSDYSTVAISIGLSAYQNWIEENIKN
ncbi:S1 family peptidase [Aquimarina agarivorans]|uniref:S1 family peptidase n=1 Tax=Aquimarina agarivorans TaxID=980584 RepID=UPI000248E886|nr:trypsin-like serine protease [Aquimarina agarivorans]